MIHHPSKPIRLAALLSLAAAPLLFAAEGGFNKKLSLQGITFHVTCPNEGSINNLRIVAKGLTNDAEPIKMKLDGTVTGAEIADLNSDGSPEIYIYTQSAGSGSYGNVIAYAANKKKSLTAVTLPDLSGNKTATKGYVGHDEFAIVESRLVRRFQLHKKSDTNAAPTGRIRQLSYRLEAGEAGWILRLDKVADI